MNLTEQLAKHFRGVHVGGNWTALNLKDSLKDVTWQQATNQVHSFNTISVLVYHTNYFVVALVKVLNGNPLDAHDKLSFSYPPIQSAEDWQNMLDKVFINAKDCAGLIERLQENKLWEDFSENKYGNYYRNIQGIVEHLHYHLGQIVLIKKLLLQAV